MSTDQIPRDLDPSDLARPAVGELRLNPLVHGRGRVPGRRKPMFDLAAFVGATEHGDVAYQLACYAPDADIRVLDPDSPPPTARTITGARAIRFWLDRSDALDVEVTHLVDGGDRVAFTQRWRERDGTAVVATSTAELSDGLITTQHTILAWTPTPLGPSNRWTRANEGLWTTTD
jgi:hypothetical protein